MRAALWFIGLFGIAVAVALFVGNNQGTVTLFWPPYRIDLSLNMVLLLLVASFVLCHAALRGLSVLTQLPRQARRWREQQKERAMHHALLDALSHLQAGRFLRARKSALSALALEESLSTALADVPHGRQLRATAHMVAAEGSHALQDTPQREIHLAQVLECAPHDGTAVEQETREGAQMRAARWALDDRDALLALERLAALPQGASRRTLALRIKLKAARLARHTENALETARMLAKHRAFSPAASASIVRGLVLELIHDTRDTGRLQQLWLDLDPDERVMPEIAVPAARQLVRLGGDLSQARAWLLPVWEYATARMEALSESQMQTLVLALQDCLDGIDSQWLARIETASRNNPREPRLQYLAGMACVQRQLWGKAQQLLTQCAPQLGAGPLRVHAWQQLARMAEHRNDSEAAAAAWKQAALSL
jgi:HemY protein